ncbi:MAG: hypothetical protein ACKOA4_03660 [Haliscomenobacter sp.]
MRDTEALKKELADLAPLLGALKEGPSGHGVPEGYFEELREKVLSGAAVAAPLEAPAGKGRPSARKWFALRSALAYAAALALVLGGWYAFSKREKQVECTELACLDPAELNAFIEWHIEQFDTGTILEAGNLTSSFGAGFELSAADAQESREVLLQAVEALSEDEIEALMD